MIRRPPAPAPAPARSVGGQQQSLQTQKPVVKSTTQPVRTPPPVLTAAARTIGSATSSAANGNKSKGSR
jgi:hypothetical protein